MTSTEAWKQYQEEVAEFFGSLGMNANTDVRTQGVRTTHDIDVLVTLPYAGFRIRWIIECKRWQTRITKLHVLALREIVSDVGADRGILLAEAGFQVGAFEAATLTNVQLTSLAELRGTAESQIYIMRVMDLYDRVQSCRERYWAIDKYDRIEHGLRPDVGLNGYMGDQIITLADDLLKKAMRGVYPIETDAFRRFLYAGLPSFFASVRDLHSAVEVMVIELEAKIAAAEKALGKQSE